MTHSFMLEPIAVFSTSFWSRTPSKTQCLWSVSDSAVNCFSFTFAIAVIVLSFFKSCVRFLQSWSKYSVVSFAESDVNISWNLVVIQAQTYVRDRFSSIDDLICTGYLRQRIWYKVHTTTNQTCISWDGETHKFHFIIFISDFCGTSVRDHWPWMHTFFLNETSMSSVVFASVVIVQ
jgi:hypothetical protein